MQQFAAAIFDMDGLLLDSEKLALAAFQSTCSEFNLGDQSELFFRCVGTNAEMGRSILKDGLEDVMDFEMFGRFWNSEYRRISEESPIPLKVGAKNLLLHLESLNIPMAVATSTDAMYANEKLRFSGIRDFFDVVVGGDHVRRSKPDPEIYLKAASLLDSDPFKCLAFEDSANGVKAAVAAGMTVIQVPDLVKPDSALLRLGHIVLESLADVPNLKFPAE